MSGVPYPEGVRQAVHLIDELARLAAEVNELIPKAARLKEAREEHASRMESLRALLRSMDIVETGNYGHHDRLAWFLQEMRSQVRP